MSQNMHKTFVFAFSLGLASSAFAAERVGKYATPGAAVLAKVSGVKRAVTAGLDASQKSHVVAAVMKDGAINRVLVDSRGEVRDEGNVIPKAEAAIAEHLRTVEGIHGFKIVRHSAPINTGSELKDLTQTLSSRGKTLRFGIEQDGRIISNRLYNIVDGRVTGDSIDRAESK